MRFSRHHKLTLAYAVGLGLLLILPSAQAATFHVSPQGSDTPPYDSYAKAAHDVADAVVASSGYGDTVFIHTGEYDVDTTMDLPMGVALRGVDRDSVALIWRKLDGIQFNWMVNAFGKNSISGLNFVNPLGAPGDPWSRSIFMSSSLSEGNLKVTRCRFDQLGLSVATKIADTIEISDSELLVWSGTGIKSILGRGLVWVHDNRLYGGRGPASGGGKGIRVTDGTALIERNEFDYRETELRGVPVEIGEYLESATLRNNLIIGGRSPIYWISTDGLIENNTIMGPEHAEQGIIIYQDDDNELTLRNNLLVDLPHGFPLANFCSDCPPASFVVTNNTFWPPEGALWSLNRNVSDSDHVIVYDTANFSAIPMTTGDPFYHLQFGSPLIDAGHHDTFDIDSSVADIGWTGGAHGFPASYPDLPPLPPESLSVWGEDGIVTIEWMSRPETDLDQYRLYRDVFSGFWMPGLGAHRILPWTDTSAVDTGLIAGQSYYYVVTAVDQAGFESEASNEAEHVVTGVFDDHETRPIPREYRIVQAFPNPFNATTTFEIHSPKLSSPESTITVEVYDVLGRRVSTLADLASLPGSQLMTWNAISSSGRPLSSGVYFARLRVSGTVRGKAVKLVLVR